MKDRINLYSHSFPKGYYTNEQIKEEVKKNIWNGEYIMKICKGCGMLWCTPESNTDDAEIVEVCKECFD